MYVPTYCSLGSCNADTCADKGAEPLVLRLEDCQSLRLPPGLELAADRVDSWFARAAVNKVHSLTLEVGLPAKILADVSDDETSAASVEGYEPSQSSSASHEVAERPGFDNESPASPSNLDDQSQQLCKEKRLIRGVPIRMSLKLRREVPAKVQSEVPAVSLNTDTPAVSNQGSMRKQPVSIQPLALTRTKLSAKAAAFQPLPFVPMATVRDAWQKWPQGLM